MKRLLLPLRKLYQEVLLIVTLMVFTSLCLIPSVAAQQMTTDDILSTLKNTVHYQNCEGGAAGAPQGTAAATGKVYMIGDSITQGAKTQLDAAFKAKGFTTTEINGVASRKLSEGSTDLDGITVLGNDKPKYADASTIVIALGTNGGVTDMNIGKAIDLAKAGSPTAKIYWVNVGVDNNKRSGADIDATSINQIITGNTSRGYAVIDWAAQVAAHSEYINNDGLGVHLESAGNDAFANTVATGASGGTAFLQDQSPIASTKPKGILARVKNFFSGTASAQAAPPPNTGQPGATALTPTTLRDKIAQMLLVRVDNQQQADTAAQHNVGGVYIRETGSMLNAGAISGMKGKFKIAPIIATDGEGGQVDALGKAGVATPLPSAKDLGTKEDAEVTQLVTEYSKKMKDLGFTMNFAPVLDLDNGSNPIIGALGRGFSSDPAVVTAKGQAYAKGLEANGIIPVFKHFPGHGNASGDSHLGKVDTPPLDQLKAADLKPYETIAPGAKAVMMGHLDVPGLTKPGEPASISKEAISLLRTDYKFQGVIMTDDLSGMKAITDLGLSGPQAMEKAILAGEDMLLTNANVDVKGSIDYLEQQANQNVDLQNRINESSARIQNLKQATSFQQPNTDPCNCAVTAATLPGNNVKEQVWNYFLSKQFGPKVIAGIMGNIQAESGFDPAIVEKGNGIGFGLVQWSFGRRTALEQAAAAKGVPPSDLSFQLDFLWQELEGPYKSNTLDPLRAINESDADALARASNIFLENFERPADIPGNRPKRIAFAEAILAELGSLSGGGYSSASATCASGQTNGVTGGFSLPTEEKWYNEHKDWFTKPHHDYPAADIPVPTGTPIFSMTAGKIISAPTGDACGIGVQIDAGDGVHFIYCHGSDGGSVENAKQGDTVQPGQLIMHSASTGNSSGPHLHLGLRINGTNHCPQTLFVGIVEGSIPDVKTLPTSGCSY